MLNVLVAHHAEGAPFRDRYALSKTRQGGLGLACSDSVRLLVTGEGARRAGASLAAMWQSLDQPQCDRWLNFGVAGSADLAIGTLAIADEFCPVGTATRLRSNNLTSSTSQFGLPMVACQSVDRAAGQYPKRGVVDMEATSIADFLGSKGALQNLTVLKLVSDSPESPPPNRDALRALVISAGPDICRVSDMILAKQRTEP